MYILDKVTKFKKKYKVKPVYRYVWSGPPSRAGNGHFHHEYRQGKEVWHDDCDYATFWNTPPGTKIKKGYK